MPPASAPIRAVRLLAHGEPVVSEVVEIADPGEDEVRVELEFGGINPIDRYIAEGRVAPDAPLPRTLGGEAAGSIDGRPVLVAGEGLGTARDGVWSGAAVVPIAAVVPLPEGVSTREAAAMGIAGLTAWEVVHEIGRVTAEDRVLVLAAPGGVGSMIVSLARAVGATVWGQTGSPEKVAFAEQQGAERVVVGGPEELAEALPDFAPTIAFESLGDGFVAPVLESLAPRGRLVSFGTSADPQVELNMQTVYRKMLSILSYGGMQIGREERRRGLVAVLDALQDGRLKVRIDDVLGLDQVNEAFDRLVQRTVQGNLLLDLSR